MEIANLSIKYLWQKIDSKLQVYLVDFCRPAGFCNLQ